MSFFERIKQIFTVKELKNKILFILFILVIFRLFAHVPVPGIDPMRLKEFFSRNQFFGLLNVFTGGGMTNMSIMMLGIGPYVTASIIMQLMAVIFPQLEKWYREEGQSGQDKFNRWTKYLTVPLAILQSFSMIALLRSQGIITNMATLTMVATICAATAGSMLLIWLGDLINEKNIGDGVSLIIFAGIVSGIPAAIQRTYATWDVSKLPVYLGFLAMAIVIIAGTVLITEAQRNISVSYAKRIQGNKVYGGTSTYLPIRVNQAGMVPIIFSMSVMLFPGMVGMFLSRVSIGWIASIAGFFANWFNYTIHPIFYGSMYFLLTFAFTYFYVAITFDPKNIAENLQKQGGFIPGQRPGYNTQVYLAKILNRVTLVGASFLGLMALLPFVMQAITNMPTLTISGAALLIVVGVVLDMVNQIEAQLIMRHYEEF